MAESISLPKEVCWPGCFDFPFAMRDEWTIGCAAAINEQQNQMQMKWEVVDLSQKLWRTWQQLHLVVSQRSQIWSVSMHAVCMRMYQTLKRRDQGSCAVGLQCRQDSFNKSCSHKCETLAIIVDEPVAWTGARMNKITKSPIVSSNADAFVESKTTSGIEE